MAQKPLIVTDSDSDTRERPTPVEINRDQPDCELCDIYRFLICREFGDNDDSVQTNKKYQV